MTIKTKIGNFRTYFLRGHMYGVLLVSLLNFLTIQFYLLLEKFEPLRILFMDSFIYFSILFTTSYVFLCTILGFWDYKKGFYKEEGRILWNENPSMREVSESLKRIETLLQKILENEEC